MEGTKCPLCGSTDTKYDDTCFHYDCKGCDNTFNQKDYGFQQKNMLAFRGNKPIFLEENYANNE